MINDPDAIFQQQRFKNMYNVSVYTHNSLHNKSLFDFVRTIDIHFEPVS